MVYSSIATNQNNLSLFIIDYIVTSDDAQQEGTGREGPQDSLLSRCGH